MNSLNDADLQVTDLRKKLEMMESENGHLREELRYI